MNYRAGFLLSALFAACLLPGHPRAAATEPEEMAPGTWRMSTDGERYSLWANEVDLEDFLHAIQRLSSREIRIDALEDRMISVRYYNVTLDELLARLGLNYFLVLRKAKEEQYELESGWISFFEPRPILPAFPVLAKGGDLPPDRLLAFPEEIRRRLTGSPTGKTRAEDVGVIYRAAFPVPIELDGNVNDWPEGVPWQVVSHEMGYNTPTNDADSSFAIASVADDEQLFMAIQINDDMKATTNALALPLERDDMMRLMIDAGGPGVPAGGDPGFAFTINRHHVLRTTDDGQLVASPIQYVSHHSGARAAIVDGPKGWTLEVSVPYSSLNVDVKDGQQIGFNLVLNDRDAEDVEDHQLIWSGAQRVQRAGSVPNLGAMKFISIR